VMDGTTILLYIGNSLLKMVDKTRGTLSRSAFIRYTLEEVVNNKKPELCSIELSHLKKENIELRNKLARLQKRTPSTVRNVKDLDELSKIRFIEILTEDTEAARRFRPPKRGDTGFKRWQDRSRFMVDKYKDLCGLELQPHEWINLVENNPALKMGEEKP
jgi:hypothetical protein